MRWIGNLDSLQLLHSPLYTLCNLPWARALQTQLCQVMRTVRIWGSPRVMSVSLRTVWTLASTVVLAWGPISKVMLRECWPHPMLLLPLPGPDQHGHDISHFLINLDTGQLFSPSGVCYMSSFELDPLRNT